MSIAIAEEVINQVEQVVEPVIETAAAEPAIWMVCVMGIGIVFVGLVCLIALISLLGSIMKRVAPKEEAPKAVAAAPVAEAIPNRGELVAAVSAALAEELGTDIKYIRIHSIKRA